MMGIRLACVLLAAAWVCNCAPHAGSWHDTARGETRQSSLLARAGELLDIAHDAQADLRRDSDDPAALLRYNAAVSELVLLLRHAPNDRAWNRPLHIQSPNRSYHLTFASASESGIWDSGRFTRLIPAANIRPRNPDARHVHHGIGAAMVGIDHRHPQPRFYKAHGLSAPVTAVVEFHKSEARLALLDPVRIRETDAGRISADPVAALDWYPYEPAWWNGVMGAIRGSNYQSGLFMLQPYDARRIPLVFVHGLVSTPQMWREVIHAIEADPALRGRYQYWVFRYPTGNPPSYSALRLREELQAIYRQHPDAPECVLVGHSMGGILSRMQAVTVTRDDWNVIGKENADRFFSIVKPGSTGDRATRFDANPKVERLVFICTPHRGSRMAIGTVGRWFKELIALPADLTGPLRGDAASAIAIVSGTVGKLPNSITGLSPNNAMLKVLDSIPLEIPHHSIIGDRGKGDGPESSDGVVDYWSSHLASADSELIVPGPHGSHNRPETLAELRRILRLHLASTRKSRPKQMTDSW
jgi:pimeloyl-ACP methyl ester carboxylesterase